MKRSKVKRIRRKRGNGVVEYWSDGEVETLPAKSKLAKRAQDLVVFKRAYKFSLQLHKTSLNFPKIEQFALADQLRRCSKSVCANLIEGFAKQSQSKIEFKRFITIAIGSANEIQLWIHYSFDLGYIDKNVFDNWIRENDAIIGMLIKFRNSITP